jgi:hypothetical protein
LDQAGVLEKATSHFVRQLGHKSLKEKNALLLNVVSSRAKTQDDSISRSENLIIQFDRARHEIVHEDGLAHGNYSTIYQDLDRVIRHLRSLVLGIARSFGISEEELTSQMSALSLEGVATPWKREGK